MKGHLNNEGGILRENRDNDRLTKLIKSEYNIRISVRSYHEYLQSRKINIKTI